MDRICIVNTKIILQIFVSYLSIDTKVKFEQKKSQQLFIQFTILSVWIDINGLFIHSNITNLRTLIHLDLLQIKDLDIKVCSLKFCNFTTPGATTKNPPFALE